MNETSYHPEPPAANAIGDLINSELYFVITGPHRPSRKRGFAGARPGDPYGRSTRVDFHHGLPGQARQ
jgi:hypothetical protein